MGGWPPFRAKKIKKGVEGVCHLELKTIKAAIFNHRQEKVASRDCSV